MFIKLTNGVPETYTIGQLRRDYPNTSFPKDIPDEMLESYGVYSVQETKRPSHNPETHYINQSDFYQVDGKWCVSYNIEPLPELQVAEKMRDIRNKLLAETDWVVAKAYEDQDVVPTEWAKYRQSLRDITNQLEFPYYVIWPTKP